MPNSKVDLHTPIGPGREFDLVRELLALWGPQARGIGDDAAVVDVPSGQHLVVSTDTSVDNIHFRQAWLTPEEIGWRSTMAALSDLAAMAASPLGMVLAFVLPPSFLPRVGDLAIGIGAAAESAGIPIIGGDLSGGETLSIGVTVLGTSRAPVPRRGARAGDLVYVTGRLGGAGAALRAFQTGTEPHPDHRRRFARPHARIAEGLWLASAGAHAMIDISDGLAAELGHLATASTTRFEIDLARIPAMPDVHEADAVRSGEEYELVVAAPKPLDSASFEASFGLPLTCIGRVSASDRGEVRFTRDGVLVDLTSGYEHFSS
jgi:thiamine-monophosphate kinase